MDQEQKRQASTENRHEYYLTSDELPEAPRRDEQSIQQSNLSQIKLERYTEAMDAAPPASEMLTTYFLFAMTGIKLPSNEAEKRDFIASFAIAKFSGNFDTSSNAVSPSARIIASSAADIHKEYLDTLRAAEASRKDRIKSGDLVAENVEEYTRRENKHDAFEKVREEIEQRLRASGIKDQEIRLSAFAITKEISLELISFMLKDEKMRTEIDSLNRLLIEGKHEEIFNNFISLVGSSETEIFLDQVKDRVLSEWIHKHQNN